MNTITDDARDLEVGIWPADPFGHDGDLDNIVVQIDTGPLTKKLRVNVNDATIWDADPEDPTDALASCMQRIVDQVDSESPIGTPERTRLRMQLIFGMFYDDKEGEPDQAIRDVLTDLMHVAAERGVDFEKAVQRAAWMWNQEREEWGLDG